jgi:RNA polymerase primary sigma factor
MAPKDDEPKKPEDTTEGGGSMLDMSQAAVKKMIATAKSRGYITYDELNDVLPQDQTTSEQIEDVMAMLSEMGINVIDNEEAEDEDAPRDAAAAAEESS